jgi:hypothetical protein
VRRLLPPALVLLLVVTVAWVLPAFGAGDGDPPQAIFEISVKGKSWASAVIVNPGLKVGIGKVDDKLVADVLTGVNLEDYSVDFIDKDDGGKLYLYYYSREQMGYATNPDGVDVTLMRGQCAPDGNFWMYGFYEGGFAQAFSNADCMFTGRITWESTGDSGQYVPLKIKGTLFFVSQDITTGMTLKVKTKALVGG